MEAASGGSSPRTHVSELAESLELYQSLVRASPDAVTATDLEGRITAVSRRTLELHGGETDADLIGCSALDFIVPEEHERAMENLAITLEAGVVGPVEYTMVRRDGSRFDGDLCAAVVRDHAGAPKGFVATTRDVSAAKRAQAALTESEARYRTLVEMSPDPVVILRGERYRYANAAFSKLFGYSEQDVRDGLTFMTLVPEHEARAVRARYEARMAGKELPATFRVDLLTKDGRLVPCETSARLIQYEGKPADIVIIRDVTEREQALLEQRRLEARIQQSQKLESLGLLAGGVAHDFNNLLAAILGNVELLKHELPRTVAVSERLSTLETTVHHASELCNQLLEYAGRRPRSVTRVDLEVLVGEILDMLAATFAADIRVNRRMQPGLPEIFGNPAQLRQAVMNLLTNAADAMAGRSGAITVSTGDMDCDDAYLAEQTVVSHARPGAHVYVEVTDEGSGMDAAVLNRILDPFFTTKSKGRGLGLAAVQSCLALHQGALSIRSEVDRGSTFRLILPVPRRK